MSAIPAVLLHPLASTPTQHLRPKEVGHEGTGRACAPWLIARGRSLDVPRLDRVALHHSSFGSDAASARFATILVELGIANPSDWEACAGEPAKFLRRTLDRFVRSHGESEIDEAFELSVTLSTDPHEWCESEDEPDGSQIFLCVEASSCGFVNLAPALALCENEHPRLPATFARMFLNSVGSHFRIYDDRDAEEHISILEDNYEPEADGEERAGLPDRNKILPPCMKRKPLGGKGLKAMLSRMTPKSRAARLLRATLADDVVKITDFGTAKILQFGTAQTAHVMGTPSYMSPEQVKGKPVDGRSDIFSLGVVLYELMTGEKPFPGENITTVIYKIINEEPVPPRSLDSSIHPGLSAVISRALAKDPAARYQSCHELLSALKNYHEMMSPEATVRMAPVGSPPAKGISRSGGQPSRI